MARFLFVWELGGGSGHWAKIEPLARRLLNRGHDVTVALRNVAVADPAVKDLGIRVLPAPYTSAALAERLQPQRTLAHILHNMGWCGEERLGSSVAKRARQNRSGARNTP